MSYPNPIHDPVRLHSIKLGTARAPEFQAPTKPKVPETIIFPANKLQGACEIAGISVADATSPKRDRGIADKRFHVMWLLHQAGLSYVKIGLRLNRDHTSIMHGCRRWETIIAGKAAA